MTRMIYNESDHDLNQSPAERLMLRRIETARDTDDWVCLYSINFHVENKQVAEADFVVINHDGVFVVEVKGGGIQRENGTWTSLSSISGSHNIKDPFMQARNAMFGLRSAIYDRLQTLDPSILQNEDPLGPSADSHDRPLLRFEDIGFGYGVMFPDCEFHAKVLGIPSQKIIFDQRTAEKPLTRYFRDLCETFDRRHKPEKLSKTQIQAIANLLCEDFDFPESTPALHGNLSPFLDSMMEEHLKILDGLRANERLLITGTAGTGKTKLARGNAIREAGEGLRVLLVCYNDMLAEHYRRSLSQEAAREEGLIHVVSIYDLFYKLIESSSKYTSAFRDARNGKSNDVLHTEILPKYALKARKDTDDLMFDVLIVDEAQDIMNKSLCDVLFKCLRGGMTEGRWCLYADNNPQAALYDRMDERQYRRLEKLAARYELTECCRLTTTVTDAINNLVRPPVPLVGRWHGPSVETQGYLDDQDLIAKISTLLVLYRERKGIAAEKISILFVRRPSDEVQAALLSAGVFSLNRDSVREYGNDRTIWATVASYKSIENDVVLLVGLEDLESDLDNSRAYIGMAAARIDLALIVPQERLGSIRRALSTGQR